MFGEEQPHLRAAAAGGLPLLHSRCSAPWTTPGCVQVDARLLRGAARAAAQRSHRAHLRARDRDPGCRRQRAAPARESSSQRRVRDGGRRSHLQPLARDARAARQGRSASGRTPQRSPASSSPAWAAPASARSTAWRTSRAPTRAPTSRRCARGCSRRSASPTQRSSARWSVTPPLQPSRRRRRSPSPAPTIRALTEYQSFWETHSQHSIHTEDTDGDVYH